VAGTQTNLNLFLVLPPCAQVFSLVYTILDPHLTYFPPFDPPPCPSPSPPPLSPLPPPPFSRLFDTSLVFFCPARRRAACFFLFRPSLVFILLGHRRSFVIFFFPCFSDHRLVFSRSATVARLFFSTIALVFLPALLRLFFHVFFSPVLLLLFPPSFFRRSLVFCSLATRRLVFFSLARRLQAIAGVTTMPAGTCFWGV
jgi:hypothetical protein